jgi:type 1 glutamine amidotransferase
MRCSTSLACVLALMLTEVVACSQADSSSSAQGGTSAVAGGGSAAVTGGSSGKSGASGTGGSAGASVAPSGGSDAARGGANGGNASSAGGGGMSGSAFGGSANSGSAGATNAPTGGTSGGGAAGFAGAGNGGAPVGGAGAGGSAAGGAAGAGGFTGGSGGSGGDRPARVLLYSFSTLDIPSVPAQLSLLEQELEKWQYETDRSEDPAVFNDDSLSGYAAVGMINTCFWPFGANQPGTAQSEALQRFLKQGGGLFGTHCADVTFQSANPPALYNQLIGGRASSQNFDGTSDCKKAADHPTTAGLPAAFQYSGNLDATDFLAPDITVLTRCTWATGKEVAVSWVRMEGAGRVFYTNFGKVDSDFTHPTIGTEHLFPGLAWVLGRPGT